MNLINIINKFAKYNNNTSYISIDNNEILLTNKPMHPSNLIIQPQHNDT